jgi:hypothetical protein
MRMWYHTFSFWTLNFGILQSSSLMAVLLNSLCHPFSSAFWWNESLFIRSDSDFIFYSTWHFSCGIACKIYLSKQKKKSMKQYILHVPSTEWMKRLQYEAIPSAILHILCLNLLKDFRRNFTLEITPIQNIFLNSVQAARHVVFSGTGNGPQTFKIHNTLQTSS